MLICDGEKKERSIMRGVGMHGMKGGAEGWIDRFGSLSAWLV